MSSIFIPACNMSSDPCKKKKPCYRPPPEPKCGIKDPAKNVPGGSIPGGSKAGGSTCKPTCVAPGMKCKPGCSSSRFSIAGMKAYLKANPCLRYAGALMAGVILYDFGLKNVIFGRELCECGCCEKRERAKELRRREMERRRRAAEKAAEAERKRQAALAEAERKKQAALAACRKREEEKMRLAQAEAARKLDEAKKKAAGAC